MHHLYIQRQRVRQRTFSAPAWRHTCPSSPPGGHAAGGPRRAVRQPRCGRGAAGHPPGGQRRGVCPACAEPPLPGSADQRPCPRPWGPALHQRPPRLRLRLHWLPWPLRRQRPGPERLPTEPAHPVCGQQAPAPEGHGRPRPGGLLGRPPRPHPQRRRPPVRAGATHPENPGLSLC